MRWIHGFLAWTVAVTLLAMAFVNTTSAEERLWLVHDGQSCAAIVFGSDNIYAAERLQRYFTDQTGAKMDLVSAEQWKASDSGLSKKRAVILIGSDKSNPVLHQLATQYDWEIDPNAITEQGYLAKRLSHDGRDWVILAGGGRDGAQYATVDLFQWNLQCEGKDVWLASLDTKQIPRCRYRWLWNWDGRMDWGGSGNRSTKMAEAHEDYAYSKSPDAYLVDGKRCIDYMADHKFNSLALWGFLRDAHGGIPASQELCRYAKHRGVRILPGVGTSGYGGYYYQGQHEFNCGTWLAMHPELRAVDKQGKPRPSICPSKKANQDWLDRGAAWLFKTFDIGGVNLEMGDFYVCYCDDCKQARAAIPSNEPDYFKDMAISHKITVSTMRRIAPDAWLSYATYSGFTPKLMKTQSRPMFLSMIPEDAICQWTLSGMAAHWPAMEKPMARHNIGYVHWCNVSSNTAHHFFLTQIHDLCRKAVAAGFEGIDAYGELSADRPNVEITYLAWEAFLWNPEMTLEQFADQRLARIYGGEKAARILLEIIPLVCDKNERTKPGNLDRATQLAESARAISSEKGRTHWDRLLAYLRNPQINVNSR